MDENSYVQHIGFISNDKRYDFSIIYTNHFYGKTIISCIQSGSSTLLDHSELDDFSFIQKAFKLKDLEEASAVSLFLQTQIPSAAALFEQY